MVLIAWLMICILNNQMIPFIMKTAVGRHAPLWQFSRQALRMSDAIKNKVTAHPTALESGENQKMKIKEDIIEKQKDFIQNLRGKTSAFINEIDKSEIETILISGSVSRGDYFPGKIDGMVDLIVMKKNGSTATAESVFGKNQKPFMTFYHCVENRGLWHQILFTDFITVDIFKTLDEPRKFSVLESQALYDSNSSYKNELAKIKQFSKDDVRNSLNGALGYIHYLISEYKKDRWYRREAFIQLHENLNAAIRAGIRSLFYLNGFYCPAEDRAIYHSHSLPKLPENYADLILQACTQVADSEEDYFRREKIFMEKIVRFIEENKDFE